MFNIKHRIKIHKTLQIPVTFKYWCKKKYFAFSVKIVQGRQKLLNYYAKETINDQSTPKKKSQPKIFVFCFALKQNVIQIFVKLIFNFADFSSGHTQHTAINMYASIQPHTHTIKNSIDLHKTCVFVIGAICMQKTKNEFTQEISLGICADLLTKKQK